MINNPYLQKSTVQLCELDNNLMLTGIASGCLVLFCQKRFLLTVEHATGNKGNWAIELEYDKSKGAKLYQLGSMNFVMQFTLPNIEGEVVDFAYVEIPQDLEVFRHFLTPQGDTIRKDLVYTYSDGLDNMPSKEDTFSFSGCVMPEKSPNLYEPDRPYIIKEFRCYEGLNYLRKEGELLFFKLPFDHPGDDHFKGCSGAPLINSKNEVVGLICGRYTENDEIYAISLKAMSAILEASILTDNHQ